MNILKATKRTSVTTGQVNKLRSDGFIPAVSYGGKKNNLNVSYANEHKGHWIVFPWEEMGDARESF